MRRIVPALAALAIIAPAAAAEPPLTMPPWVQPGDNPLWQSRPGAPRQPTRIDYPIGQVGLAIGRTATVWPRLYDPLTGEPTVTGGRPLTGFF